MDSSGAIAPLVLHRRPARRHRILVVAATVSVVAGVVIIVSSLILAGAEEGVHRWKQGATALFGVAAVVYGAGRLVAYRGVLSREAIVSLDDRGVSVRNGTVRSESWARLVMARRRSRTNREPARRTAALPRGPRCNGPALRGD